MLPVQRHGSGPEVVLIHGFMSSSAAFAELRATLANRFSVTAVDLPGFGVSTSNPVADSIDTLAEMVHETVASRSDASFSLVGHSLGAMLALQITLDNPDQVEKLVLYGGCASGHVPNRFETYEDSIRQIKDSGIEAVAASIVAKWFVSGARHPRYEVARAAADGADQRAAIRYLETMGSWDQRDRLGELSTPTLVLCGDRDRATHPDLSLELWRNIAHAQLCIVPNCGHIVHLEAAGLFTATLERFLTGSQLPSEALAS